MTGPLLLACITAALLFQLAIGIGVAAWRRRVTAAEAPIAEDIDVPQPSLLAWRGLREFRVSRREYEDRARSQCSFYLEPLDGVPLPPFRPGQFLTISLQVSDTAAGAQSKKLMITRCYSVSGRPDASRYRVTIKRVPAPAGRSDLPQGVCSNYFHDRIHEGDVITVKAPSGLFFIDPDPALPAVFIAGGIGITPIMSMVEWCLAEQAERPLHLYYGLRRGDEHAFKAILEELANSHPAFHLNVVYSRPGPEDRQGRDFQHAGRVDVELLRRTLSGGRYQFYVCGPAPMMETLIPALGQWGVLGQDIHYEAFGPASLPSARTPSKQAGLSGATPVAVRFRRTGRTLMWNGENASLLDFAERHGVSVESGCRSGSCGSCETKLVSGTVLYADKPDYEVAPGYCLLCIATPESPIVLEA